MRQAIHLVVAMAAVMLNLACCVSLPMSDSAGGATSRLFSPATVRPTLLPTDPVKEAAPPATPPSVIARCPGQPCWEGMRPGHTTAQAVERYLAEHLSAQETRFLGRVEEDACLGFGWLTESSRSRREIHTTDDVMTYLYVDVITPTVTLRALVDQLGLPEYIYSVMEMPEPSAPYGARYQLEVFYPNAGLIFGLKANQPGMIQPDLLVDRIEYTFPGTLMEIIRARLFCPERRGQSALDIGEEDFYYAQPWSGYGRVAVYQKSLGALPIQRRPGVEKTPKAVQP